MGMKNDFSNQLLAVALGPVGFTALVLALFVGAARLSSQGLEKMEASCRAEGGRPEWVQPSTVNNRPVSPTFQCVR
jgi:hypothetical protein